MVACPQCKGEYTYFDEDKLICPECFYEGYVNDDNKDKEYYDANGNLLQNGDSVVLIKGLKVKGATKDLKVGQKVKNIRLVDSDHDIECKIDGFGKMMLKSEFVKKI